MKTNLLFSSFLAVSLLCISCKKEEETTSETPKQIFIPPVETTTAQTFGQQQPAQNVVITPTQAGTPQGITPAQMQQVVTKAGMNPPHGQPGHRCDIAVGAPLNSKPLSKSTPGGTITTAPSPSFTTTNAPAVATAPGMNPPHGQPGHVCGTPVGSPLPTGEAATITTTPAPTPQSTEAEAK